MMIGLVGKAKKGWDEAGGDLTVSWGLWDPDFWPGGLGSTVAVGVPEVGVWLEWTKIEISFKTFESSSDLPFAMSWAAVVLLVRAICFGAWESDVTVRAVAVDDNRLCWLADNLLNYDLTRSIVAVRGRWAGWRGCLVHSHVPIEWDFLVGAVWALSARVLLSRFHWFRRRLATVRVIRCTFLDRIAVGILSVRAVVGLMSF